MTGEELWISDGTESGTALVMDIRGAAGWSSPANLTLVGGTSFLFSANDGIRGTELWKSDGTGAGTNLVKDIRPGPEGSKAAQFTVFGNLCFFLADEDGINGPRLWRSDGTDAGTFRIRATTGGPVFVQSLKVMGNRLYFMGGTGSSMGGAGSSGMELWKSDGTNAGTVIVKDIRAGEASSNPKHLTVMQGFRALGGIYLRYRGLR